jgi:hypothetical protein
MRILLSAIVYLALIAVSVPYTFTLVGAMVFASPDQMQDPKFLVGHFLTMVIGLAVFSGAAKLLLLMINWKRRSPIH